MRNTNHRQVLCAILFLLFLCGNIVLAVNSPPTAVSVSPSSGSFSNTEWKKFTCTFSDANGWTNLWTVKMLINTSAVYPGGVYCAYSQNTNKFYMANDAGVQIPSSGIIRGQSYLIESAGGYLDCRTSTISGIGNNLTVTFYVKMKYGMCGKALKIYLAATDDASASVAWTQRATTQCNFANHGPGAVSAQATANPIQHSTWTNLNCTYSDADGRADLWHVRALVNTSTSMSGGACFKYSLNSNKLYMVNSAGADVGGYAPGSAHIIDYGNGYLDCQNTTVEPPAFGAVPTSLGSLQLKVNFRVKYKPVMADKTHNIYLRACDDHSADTGWVDRGDVTITAPVNPPSSVYCEPTTLTLLAGTSYPYAKVHALDANGQVVTSGNSFSWSSQNTSVVTVAKTGLTPDGNYCRATVNALNVGQTTITITAGGKTTQMAVKVVVNPSTTAARFLAIPPDQRPGLNDVPVTQNGYRYMYFYGEPGNEYRFTFENAEGDQDIWISADPSFVDSTKLIDSGDNYWDPYSVDVVNPIGYGAYYVKIKGNASVNFVDATVSRGSLLRTYAVPQAWARIQPNGQPVYDSAGKNDTYYYYFPVKATAKYWVEVAKSEGYTHVWVDNAPDWITPLANGDNYWGDYRVSIVASQDGWNYIAIRGENLSNFYRLRVYAADPTIGGYQVHGSPHSITLPVGTSRTIYADCINGSGSIVTASTSFQWVSENPSVLTVTPGSMDASGFFRQATITANASATGCTDTVIRVTANGVTDRIAVRVMKMAAPYPTGVQIQPDGAPVQFSLGKDDSKLYWYQTMPGTEYALTATDTAGYFDVGVYSDPLLFDSITNGDTYWGSYTYDFVSPVYGGTDFVLVAGNQSSNTASMQLSTVTPGTAAEKYYPRGAVVPLTPNAGSLYSRNNDSDLTPDIYSFVTDTEFAQYTVSLADTAGYVDVVIADNILGESSLKSGDTYWGSFSYSFLANTVGKRYYVLVSGNNSSNHYSISLTKN